MTFQHDIPHTQTIILFDIDYTLFDTDHYKATQLSQRRLYEEITDLLEQIHGSCLLGILSEGDYHHQLSKLIETGIRNKFHDDHIHIVSDKIAALPELLKRYHDQQVIFVDDKLPVLHEAQQVLPTLKTVWIKRGVYAQQQQPIENFEPTLTLVNLQGLAKSIYSIIQR